MHKIVFQNPDGQPKPSIAQTYSTIISSTLSQMKCETHDKEVDFHLEFSPPNMYLIKVDACCDEFKEEVNVQVGRMLS